MIYEFYECPNVIYLNFFNSFATHYLKKIINRMNRLDSGKK
jgi:hypothetical protein